MRVEAMHGIQQSTGCLGRVFFSGVHKSTMYIPGGGAGREIAMYANLPKGWMELVRYTNCRTRMGEVKGDRKN